MSLNKGKGRFPPELLQKIKDAVNIIEVIGEHVVLRKSGANHSGLCPFHSERTPSFSVSESKQLYHCYGCKKGGDLVNFVMEIYGIGFPEAIEELADRAKVALPKDYVGGDSSEDPEVQRRREAAREKLAMAHKLNRFVAAFYHQMLASLPHADQYFKMRGVNTELARAFYVGVAPPSWDALASYLVAKKAPLPLAVELGLIRPSQKGARPGGPGYFDLFRNRAMFPILDMRGKVVGFGGRTLPPLAGPATHGDTAVDLGGAASPKYMNSHESFLFQKSKLAFGLYQAQKHVRETNEIILVEGYFDVLALHAAGVQNVVATCGTALTPEHLSLFRRFADRVTILFDGDKAGVAATERAMEIGLENGMILYGAVMPEGLDPDEILFDQGSGRPKSGGSEQMAAILKAAKPLLDTRIEECVTSASQGPEARTQAVKQIGGWLARYSDPVGREVRMQAVQTGLKISRGLLEQAMGRPVNHKSLAGTPRPHVAPQKKPLKTEKLARWEQILLGALIRLSKSDDSGVLNQVRSKLPPGQTLAELFDCRSARDFFALLLQRSPNTGIGGGLIGPDVDPEVRSIVTEALISSEAPQGTDHGADYGDEIKSVIDHAIGRVWARFSQQIKLAMAEAEAKKDAGLQENLMKEYLDVQRRMKEFNNSYD